MLDTGVMTIRFTVVVVAAAIVSLASSGAQTAKPVKNLLDNGDFSAGSGHWKGDGKAEIFSAPQPGATNVPPTATTPVPRPPLGGGSVKPGEDVDRSYCVTLGTRSQTFFQNFSVPRNAKILTIKFRVRTGDGFITGRASVGAFQFRLRYPAGNFTFFDEKLERSPEWQTVERTYTLTAQTRNLDFSIEVFPGAGQIYFDDFVVEALER